MIIKSLRNAGHEILRLKDCITADSPDQIVVLEAKKRNSILISLNGDFADIITYPPSKYNGIICLQIKNRPELIPIIMEILNNYLRTHIDKDLFFVKIIHYKFIRSLYQFQLK